MPHFPKPFFKPSRGTWYVEIDRKQINLGSDKDAAFNRYHDLMRSQPQTVDCTLVVGVIDAFLGWVQQNKSARTYEWYLRHCQVFAKSIRPTLSVNEFKPHHLSDCLSKLTDWSSTTKNGLCRAAQRAFRWAEDEERLVATSRTPASWPVMTPSAIRETPTPRSARSPWAAIGLPAAWSPALSMGATDSATATMPRLRRPPTTPPSDPKIGRVVIRGQALGTPPAVNAIDRFGIVAEHIGFFQLGREVIALTVAPSNDDLFIGTTGDLRLREL